MAISVFDDVAPSYQSRKHAGEWRLFLMLISLATLFPFAAAPLAHSFLPQDSSALYAFTAIVLAANFHVASTGWFYTDPEMRPHFLSHPIRYAAVPCLLILGSGAAFYFLDPTLSIYLLVAITCWQLWHYQKQNVGLLSFVAAGTDGIPLSIWERRTLGLAAFAGMLGLFSILQIELKNLSAELLMLHQIGMATYCLVPVAFCIAVIKNPALRMNKLRLLFFLFGALFFFPIFVFGDPLSALMGYTVAHGLQYLVFMGFVSVSKPNPAASAIKLIVIATCGGIILEQARLDPSGFSLPYGQALFGAALGVSMAHFVVDAGIWRLRESFQRGYMRKKFYFIFDR